MLLVSSQFSGRKFYSSPADRAIREIPYIRLATNFRFAFQSFDFLLTPEVRSSMNQLVHPRLILVLCAKRDEINDIPSSPPFAGVHKRHRWIILRGFLSFLKIVMKDRSMGVTVKLVHSMPIGIHLIKSGGYKNSFWQLVAKCSLRRIYISERTQYTQKE